MGERKLDELWSVDRKEMDKDWQTDLAWLKHSGDVPRHERSRTEGMMASFEKNPMIWAFAIVILGGLTFLMTIKMLF
jgi:hypothetical protein